MDLLEARKVIIFKPRWLKEDHCWFTFEIGSIDLTQATFHLDDPHFVHHSKLQNLSEHLSLQIAYLPIHFQLHKFTLFVPECLSTSSLRGLLLSYNQPSITNFPFMTDYKFVLVTQFLPSLLSPYSISLQLPFTILPLSPCAVSPLSPIAISPPSPFIIFPPLPIPTLISILLSLFALFLLFSSF